MHYRLKSTVVLTIFVLFITKMCPRPVGLKVQLSIALKLNPQSWRLKHSKL